MTRNEMVKLMDAFEQVVLQKRAAREAEDYWALEHYYTTEMTNAMFKGFINGYQYAKCLARMDALNLDE